MAKKVHIISHTHWDREWYLSSKFVNKWIPVFFEHLFCMLEKEPEYRFVLDGQTSIIDDCCAELKIQGQKIVDEFISKLEKYVQAGRIIIGPYYLQPDWQLVSEEALVRNMIYGKEISKEFGGGSRTGWLLDNFGQISQTSQIHEQFGMKGIVVWRGVEFPPEKVKSEFYWESPDGTRLLSVYLLSSYRNGMRLAVYPDSVHGRILNEAEKIESFAQTDNLLLMNGYDQEMDPDDILPYIKDGQADTEKYKICQSIPDEYLASVIAGLEEVQIPVKEGPLYSGRFISVFPGILSSRMYLKIRNDELQREIEEVAEPIGVMAELTGTEYPTEEINRIWKLLLKNHPHDSICGVSVDDVHTDMEDRFEQVGEQTDQCITASVQNLAATIDTSVFDDAQKVFHVFNTTLQVQKRQIELPVQGIGNVVVRDKDGKEYLCQKSENGVVAEVELPAFGWNTIGVYTVEPADSEAIVKGEGLPVMENAYMRVEFQENGTFCMTDKRNGKIYENLGYLEDCADSGDEYNYSYMKNDVPQTTLQEKAEISIVEDGPLRTVVRVAYLWELPSQLQDDRTARSEELEVLPITVYVMLQKDSPILRFRTQIRNRCKDHRVRVMFPTKIQTAHSYAQTQFDITRHVLEPETFDDTDMPENVRRIVVGARENGSITQFPQKDFVAVTDGSQGVAVFNSGLPEYEVLPKDTTIALTLFRSVSWLARTDLNTRIGDAGPEIFTPDAQCLRDMEFHYGISLFEGEAEDAQLMQRSAEMNRLYPVVQTSVHQGELNAEHSFFSMDSQGDIRVTAVKKAQDGNGVVVRLFHVGKQNQKVKMFFGDSVTEVYKTNLAEENQECLEVISGTVKLEVQPHQIVSLRVVTNVEMADRVLLKAAVVCLEKADFSEMNTYELPCVVSEQDIEREEKRAETAEAEYEACRELYIKAEKEPEEKGDKMAVLKLNMEIKHRTALEARLSAIYTWRKYQEINYGKDSKEYTEVLEKTDSEIQKLADALNIVRVERRAAEYWVDYFQREKL